MEEMTERGHWCTHCEHPRAWTDGAQRCRCPVDCDEPCGACGHVCAQHDVLGPGRMIYNETPIRGFDCAIPEGWMYLRGSGHCIEGCACRSFTRTPTTHAPKAPPLPPPKRFTPRPPKKPTGMGDFVNNVALLSIATLWIASTMWEDFARRLRDRPGESKPG